MGSRQHNFYNDAYRRAGYEDAAAEVQRLWLDGRRDEAAARVPDEMVLATNLLGTDAMVRQRIRAYRDAGITTLRVEPAGTTLDERIGTLARLMDLVESVGDDRPTARLEIGGSAPSDASPSIGLLGSRRCRHAYFRHPARRGAARARGRSR